MLILTRFLRLLSLMILLALGANFAHAQGTAFTYQGKLTDSGNPASGQYDFQFKLFDTVTLGTGTQQGSLVVVSNVTVTNGIFSAQLDFGVCATCFDGSTRFLEIAVKQTSGSTFTTLGPRQPVASNPYAIRSLNAATADGLSVACVNCVTGSQIASVNGSTVTGTIPVASVPAGSGSYIQNGTAAQTASNFNVSGNGTAGGTLSGNVVNSGTQYNIGGNRVLSNAGNSNLFAGVGTGANNSAGFNTFYGSPAGFANTTGGGNSFFGVQAGDQNTTGSLNNFFGFQAGQHNTTGCCNAFFGKEAGASNTTASGNSFFGTSAGLSNTTGPSNSFFGGGTGGNNTTGGSNSFYGYQAGALNTTGADNSFFGTSAGLGNTTASFNSFFGSNAGQQNTTGFDNSFFGWGTGSSNQTGQDDSFFGTQAGVHNTASRNSFFGSYAGFNNTTGLNNSFFGTSAGYFNTEGFENSFFGDSAGFHNSIGLYNSFFGGGAGFSNTTASGNSFFGQVAGGSNTTGDGNSFFGLQSGQNNTTGNNDTFIGQNTGLSNTTENRNTFLGSQTNGVAGISNSTAIGAFASVTQSNSLVLGSINGINGATADTSVGIGIRAPTFKLQVVDSSNTGLRVQTNAAGGTVASFGGNGNFQIDSGGTAGGRFIATESGNVGIGTATPRDALEVNGIIRVQTLSGFGVLSLCQNSLKQISTCPSSLRYKTDVHPYLGGLRVAMQLRPITFAWKDSGRQDVGFGAEDVAKIEPRLTFKNDKGEIEGVNYGQITTVLVNSIKEQQAQIQRQQDQIKSQQTQIDALRKLICLDRPNADVCK